MIGIGRGGQRFQQVFAHGIEGHARLLGAQRTQRIAPAFHAPLEPVAKGGGHGDTGVDFSGVVIAVQQGIVPLGHPFADGTHFLHQCLAARQPVQSCNVVHLLGRLGQGMGLPVVHHLQAVLDRAQAIVAFAEDAGILALDDPCPCQRIQGGARAAQAQRRIAAAIDQLVRLGVELDLANAAAPALDVEAWPYLARTLVGLADTHRQSAHLLDGGEIQAATPHEAADLLEKVVARRHVARRRARTDIGSALPGQRAAFVVLDGGVEADGQRRDLAGGAQPQVYPQHVSIACWLAQQLHQLAGIALRRFARFVPLAPGQAFRVEQQDGIDVGGIVELARALLAKRQPGESRQVRPLHPSLNHGQHGSIQRAVGKGRKPRHHRL